MSEDCHGFACQCCNGTYCTCSLTTCGSCLRCYTCCRCAARNFRPYREIAATATKNLSDREIDRKVTEYDLDFLIKAKIRW